MDPAAPLKSVTAEGTEHLAGLDPYYFGLKDTLYRGTIVFCGLELKPLLIHPKTLFGFGFVLFFLTATNTECQILISVTLL